MPYEILTDDRAGLGESPMWSPREGALYWIDTRGPRIYRYHLASGERASWETPSKVSAVCLRRGGGLVVAMKSGIAYFDAGSGTFTPVVDPEPDVADSRLNDAKVDRGGRFWVGSMEDEGQTPTGRIYRLDPDRTLTSHDDGYTVPNGPAWSPDGTRMYLSDSRRGTIYAYDFDNASGRVAKRRTFVQLAEGAGWPDGATVDAAGYLWSARINGWAIVRYAPDGTQESVLELPVSRPTSVAFGGDDLRTLFVTTGSARLSAAELATQPLAGAVLAFRVDVDGLAEPEFAG